MAAVVDAVQQYLDQVSRNLNDLPPEAQFAGMFVAGAATMYLVLEHDLFDRAIREPVDWVKRQVNCGCSLLGGGGGRTLSAAQVRAYERASSGRGRSRSRRRKGSRKRRSRKR